MHRPCMIFSGLLLNMALAAPAAADSVPLSGSISAIGTVTSADATSIDQVWGIAPRAGDAFGVRVDVEEIIPVMLTPLSSPGLYRWTGTMTFSTAVNSVSLSTDRGRARVHDVEQTCSGCTPGDSFGISLNTNTPVDGFFMSLLLYPEPYGQDWLHSPEIPLLPTTLSPFGGNFAFGYNPGDAGMHWLLGDITSARANLAPAPVPEPTSLILIGTGLAFAARRYRRFKRHPV